MKKLTALFLAFMIIVLSLSFASCSSDKDNTDNGNEAATINLGRTTIGLYVNDYFGISMSFEDEWVAISDNYKVEWMQHDHPDTDVANFDPKTAPLLPLLYIYVHGPYDMTDPTTGLVMMMEQKRNISGFEITDEQSYYDYQKAMYLQINDDHGLAVSVSELFDFTTNDGTVLKAFHTIIGDYFHQKWFLRDYDGHVMVIVITMYTDADLEMLTDVVRTTKFNIN
jgi:hypothetical protein